MKYENFYTDISYLPIFKRPARAALVPILKRHPCLLNKILFGSMSGARHFGRCIH